MKCSSCHQCLLHKGGYLSRKTSSMKTSFHGSCSLLFPSLHQDDYYSSTFSLRLPPQPFTRILYPTPFLFPYDTSPSYLFRCSPNPAFLHFFPHAISTSFSVLFNLCNLKEICRRRHTNRKIERRNQHALEIQARAVSNRKPQGAGPSSNGSR